MPRADDEPRRRRTRSPRRKSRTRSAFPVGWCVAGLVGLVLLAAAVTVGMRSRKPGPADWDWKDMDVARRGAADETRAGPPDVARPGAPGAGRVGTGVAPVERGPLPDGWQDFVAPDGSFRVYLPAAPDDVVNAPAGVPEVAGSSRVVTFEVGTGETYGLAAVTLARPDRQEALQQMAAAWEKNTIARPLGCQVSRSEVTCAGRPAIEIVTAPGVITSSPTGTSHPGNTYEVRRYLQSGDRSYVFRYVGWGTRQYNADNRRVQAFFKSFEILK